MFAIRIQMVLGTSIYSQVHQKLLQAFESLHFQWNRFKSLFWLICWDMIIIVCMLSQKLVYHCFDLVCMFSQKTMFM